MPRINTQDKGASTGWPDYSEHGEHNSMNISLKLHHPSMNSKVTGEDLPKDMLAMKNVQKTKQKGLLLCEVTTEVRVK